MKTEEGVWPKYNAKSSIHARRSWNISVCNITELVYSMQILVLRIQSWLFGVFELYLAHSNAIYLSFKRNYVQKKPDGGPLSSSHISTQLILSSYVDLFFIFHKITAFAIPCYCSEEIVIGSPLQKVDSISYLFAMHELRFRGSLQTKISS